MGVSRDAIEVGRRSKSFRDRGQERRHRVTPARQIDVAGGRSTDDSVPPSSTRLHATGDALDRQAAERVGCQDSAEPPASMTIRVTDWSRA